VITVRQAFSEDVAELMALDPIAYRSEERREAIAGWAGAGEAYVALSAGRIVGYAALTHSFFHSPYLERLVVAEADRRGGIGRALLEHCAGLVPPGEKFWTSTNQSNAPMQALLAQAGFVQSGIVENLDEGDPELIYLRLPAA
jgi:GNAT superfamily N-acetyltransferase